MNAKGRKELTVVKKKGELNLMKKSKMFVVFLIMFSFLFCSVAEAATSEQYSPSKDGRCYRTVVLYPDQISYGLTAAGIVGGAAESTLMAIVGGLVASYPTSRYDYTASVAFYTREKDTLIRYSDADWVVTSRQTQIRKEVRVQIQDKRFNRLAKDWYDYGSWKNYNQVNSYKDILAMPLNVRPIW